VEEEAITGREILPELPLALARHGCKGRVFVISDERVFSRWGERLLNILGRAGHDAYHYLVPSGEASKTLREAECLYHWLAEHRAERKEFIIAFGGGVVGDLAGFVAATYLRGMPYVQIPTTLVAQIDSSIGGKVAVDLPEGKNLVGAFYPPKFTFIETRFLDSLSRRDLLSGWAEVIKTAVLFDPELYERIAARGPSDLSPAFLLDVIRCCVQWKQRVVREDPTEQGKRTLLNYGHTIAHALEAASRYTTYLHGEAVAIGMNGEALLSLQLGFLKASVWEHQKQVLERYELPTTYNGDIAPEEIEKAITLDKKSRQGQVRWVLINDIGSPRIEAAVPRELVHEVLKKLRSAG